MLRIGPLTVDPPLLQAPLAGFTTFAQRAIVRRLGGAGLVFTEMVSARALSEMASRAERQASRLWRVELEPRPLGVQIWDNDPGLLAEVVGRLVADDQPSLIDLNFGCPAPDVAARAESGAYLLGDPERIGRIVARVVAAARPVPVTAKIRLGPDAARITAPEVVRAVEEAGGSAVTVHGRTAKQKYRGQADWEGIARLKDHLRAIPLVGNGDLTTAESAVAALRTFPVDGVMLGRAPLGRPWIFRQASALLRGEAPPPEPSRGELRDILLEHFRLVVEQHGAERAPVLMRRFAAPYGRGWPGARQFRAEVSRIVTCADFARVVEQYFPDESR